MKKYSRQREIIRNNLSGRTDHPTAEMIYVSLKAEDPKLSLGTVYRNLALLTEEGEIRRIQTGTGPDRYDGNCTEHYHFLCRCCGKVIDICPSVQITPEQLTGKWPGGRVEQMVLNLYGICMSCDGRENAEAGPAVEK